MYDEWTDRKCLRIVVSYISFEVDLQRGILDHLLSSRNGARGVDPFLM